MRRPNGSTPELAELRAVIFDVDGTLVDTERIGHRTAFNAAFAEHGLEYYWDESTYGRLLATTGGRRRIESFLVERNHPGEKASLARALHVRKTVLFKEWAASADVQARPGVDDLLDRLEAAGVTLAVCTTGTGEWVHALLDRVFGRGRFQTVVTGDDVVELKPEPDAYLLALARLQLRADQAVAVEDSRNGFVAARRAGLECWVITNDYTADQRFDGALGVYSSFTDARQALTASRMFAASIPADSRLRSSRLGQLR
jgi:HAD superfamily hydrolase (TIGR01509 family)